MFWVQVLVAGLLVPFLLGVTFIYLYWRCQPHKLVVPGESSRAQGLGLRMGNPEGETEAGRVGCRDARCTALCLAADQIFSASVRRQSWHRCPDPITGKNLSTCGEKPPSVAGRTLVTLGLGQVSY